MTFHKHIPNILTVVRLFLAVAFPFLPPEWRLPIFLVAVATEFLDGFLARIFDAVSETGKILDPIADKAFVLSVVVTIWFEGFAEFWELALIGARDMYVFGGGVKVWLFGDHSEFQRMRPRLLGKITTNFQFVFLLVALWWGDVPLALVLATGGLSVAAAIDYFLFYNRDVHISDNEETPPHEKAGSGSAPAGE
jgi:CDP-diacylglycerol--glycerol-3-phosphate 3-phosphatidyltransferase